jgi:hypothetical protein
MEDKNEDLETILEGNIGADDEVIDDGTHIAS